MFGWPIPIPVSPPGACYNHKCHELQWYPCANVFVSTWRAYLDCRFLQWLWRMGFLSPLGFLFWGDVLLTPHLASPGPVCRGAQCSTVTHFKCLRALAELSSVLLLSRSLKLKQPTPPSLDSYLIVTPVPVSMWVGEMTSLIESYYQSVQSDSRETVHQDSDEEDDGNNDENDSKDESLSQSNSSTSAIVSTSSVRFLIIRQHQLIYWQSCNIAYTQLQLTIIFLLIVNIFVTVNQYLFHSVPGPHPRVRVPLSPRHCRHHDGGWPGAREEQLLRRAPHGVVSPLPELHRLLGLVG